MNTYHFLGYQSSSGTASCPPGELLRPDPKKLTVEYLAAHGIIDAVKDFVPGTGRFGQCAHARGFLPAVEIAPRQYVTSAQLDTYIEARLDEGDRIWEDLGFSVGGTPGSRAARDAMRERLRHELQSTYIVVR